MDIHIQEQHSFASSSPAAALLTALHLRLVKQSKDWNIHCYTFSTRCFIHAGPGGGGLSLGLHAEVQMMPYNWFCSFYCRHGAPLHFKNADPPGNTYLNQSVLHQTIDK